LPLFFREQYKSSRIAQVAELVDALDLKSNDFKHRGSSILPLGTAKIIKIFKIDKVFREFCERMSEQSRHCEAICGTILPLGTVKFRFKIFDLRLKFAIKRVSYSGYYITLPR
jgi:hypothetical protein